MPDHADIAIVGAGAAGLFAAIFAGRESRDDTRIVALDGAKGLGAKILIAGGGRCNVTHDVVNPEDYAGGSPHAIKKVLRSFSVDDTVAWFAAEGVELKRENTGKLFPVTDKARTVLDALTGAAQRAGVELRTGCRVTGIERFGGRGRDTPDGSACNSDTRDGGGNNNGEADAAFTLRYTCAGRETSLHAKTVILATGGLALPSSGSDGAGYTFAKSLGHTVTPTHPALVPLLLEENHWAMTLSGLSINAILELHSPTGKRLHRRQGPVLFTHFGLSGPAPMDLSRHFNAHRDQGVTLCANLRRGETFDSTEAALRDVAERRPRASLVATIQAWLPERLARALLEQQLGLNPATPMAQLRRDDRRALAHALTALPLPVVGDRGYRHAEATAGGVPLNEIDSATMASQRCNGLHLCGELLDVDGRIGGYNFQWAWCTGRLAGRAAARGFVAATGACESPRPA